MGRSRAASVGAAASPLPLWLSSGARPGGGGGPVGGAGLPSGSGPGGAEVRQRNSTVEMLQTRDIDPCELSEVLCRKILGVNLLDFLLACVALLLLICCCWGCYRRWRRLRRRRKVKVSVIGTLKSPPHAPAKPRMEGKAGGGAGAGEGAAGPRNAGAVRQDRRDSVIERQEVDKHARQTALQIEIKANQLREVALAKAMAEALERSKKAPKRTLGQMAAQAMSLIPTEASKVSALIDEDEAGDRRGFGGLYGVERIVGKHVKPTLGMRVTRCRPRHADESSGDYEKRLQTRGTVVWVDERDLDGDGKTGDLTAVVWDATGARDVHMTGLSGVYELALARGPEGMSRSADIFRKAVSVKLVKARPWRGLGTRGKPNKGENEGESAMVDEDEALHEVITMDRRGTRRAFYRGRESYEGVLGGTKLAEVRRARGGGVFSPPTTAQPAVSLQASRLTASTGSGGDEGGGGEDDARVVQEPFGKVFVTLVGGQGLPLQPIKGFRKHRRAYVVVSVRGKEVLRTGVFEDECDPEWGVRGKGVVWGKGDTVQIDVMELWGAEGHADKVGSARLYLDDVWPEAGGWEGVCPNCEGLGHEKHDEKAVCESCVWTGMCFHRWLPLELSARPGSKVGVHCKFLPQNPPEEKQHKWRAAKDPDELQPAQLAGVSAHDSRAAEEWRKANRKCRRELRVALQSDVNEAEKLAAALGRAEELGLYDGKAASGPIGAVGGLLDRQAMHLARSAGERLQQLKGQQRRMPETARGLQASIERWSGLSSRTQKQAVVHEVSRMLQGDLRDAATLGMHRVERYKPTVESAMMVLGDVEQILDEAIAAEEAHEAAKLRREQELKQSKKARKAHKAAKKAARAKANEPKQDFPTILEREGSRQ